MIDFAGYIHPDLIMSDLKTATKQDAVQRLIDRIYESCPQFAGDVSREAAFSAVMKREEAQTTGLGEGKAFPHARIDGWKQFTIVLGFCAEGIDFRSIDKMPVHFICLMISSPDEPYLILKSMSSLLRFLNELESTGFVFENKSAIDIALAFKHRNLKVGKLIEAHDIMRKLRFVVKIDDPLDQVIKLMHLQRIDVLPVVDHENRLKGQLSCTNIFDHEIPEFFRQLHTISFVRHFDPFEKFFKLQKNLTVKDYLREECVTITPDTTLVEVIFLLTAKGHPRIFVTENEKLVGIVDRFSILDRILFF